MSDACDTKHNHKNCISSLVMVMYDILFCNFRKINAYIDISGDLYINGALLRRGHEYSSTEDGCFIIMVLSSSRVVYDTVLDEWYLFD
jgi:hypothetical protein